MEIFIIKKLATQADMKQNINVLLIVFFIFCSCNYNNEVEENIEVLKSNKSDTILNNSTYQTKLFLSNDALIKKAIKNEINNPIIVKYDTNINLNKFEYATKRVQLKEDTAYIKFDIGLNNYKNDTVVPYYWQYDFYIKYQNNNADWDTAFVTQDIIYVKISH
jgi:hypothetical protein